MWSIRSMYCTFFISRKANLIIYIFKHRIGWNNVTKHQHLILFCRYEQSDGVSRSEEAVLKNVGTEQESIEVRGSVTWTAPDGQVFTLNFVSDENGYRPEGAHIPHL